VPPKSPLACSPESNTRTDPFLRSAMKPANDNRRPRSRADEQFTLIMLGAAMLFIAIRCGSEAEAQTERATAGVTVPRTRKVGMYIERYISLTVLLAITGVDGTYGAFAEGRRCLVNETMVAFMRPVWQWLNEPTYPTSKLAGLRWVERARNYGPGK
jgi:hypothetical protein